MYDFDRIIKAAESCEFHTALLLTSGVVKMRLAWVVSWKSMPNAGLTF